MPPIPKFKKIESKNEITIVGEHKGVCEHRQNFLLPKNHNAEMEMHTCNYHDE